MTFSTLGQNPIASGKTRNVKRGHRAKKDVNNNITMKRG